MVRALNEGVTFDCTNSKVCAVGNKKLKLYEECPTPAGIIPASQLDNLARAIVAEADPHDALNGAFESSGHLESIALAEIAARLSVPPFVTLAASCARPDLCQIPYGIWAHARAHVCADEIQRLVQAAIDAQWVCDPYGQFLPFILHGGYSIGTGFTDSYVNKHSDIRVQGSTTGYIVARRDKAMLVLLCAAALEVPCDTPEVIYDVRTMLKDYI